MDDWNFLLRFQVCHCLAAPCVCRGRLHYFGMAWCSRTQSSRQLGRMPRGEPRRMQAALASRPHFWHLPEQSLSPAAWAQLEQREAPLGQRRERVQHWEMPYKQLQRVATAEGGALQRQHHRIWERLRAQTAPPPETHSSSGGSVPHRASMSARTAHGPLSDQALLRRQVQHSEWRAPSADAQSPAPPCSCLASASPCCQHPAPQRPALANQPSAC